MKTNPNDPATKLKPYAIVDMVSMEIIFAGIGKMKFHDYFTEFDMIDGNIDQDTVRRLLREDGYSPLFRKPAALNESSTKN